MRTYTLTPTIAADAAISHDDQQSVRVFEYDNNLDAIAFIEKKLSERQDWRGLEHANQNDVEGSTYYHWSGKDCKNFSEAMFNFKHGNPRYTQKFIDGLAEIHYTGDDDRTTYMDIEGFAYDMGAVVAGEPECCLNMIMPEANKALTVYVDIDFNCGVDEEKIANRGIAIANLLETLLTKNYDVTLKFIGSSNYGKDKEHVKIFNVSCKTICASEIAFYTTPEFFRMITLTMDGMCTNDPKLSGQCQGNLRLAVKEKMIKENAFLIPGGYTTNSASNLDTPQKAYEWIIDMFNQYVEQGRSPWLFKIEK